MGLVYEIQVCFRFRFHLLPWLTLGIDMDLCCLIDSNQPPLSASDMVIMLGDLLERGESLPPS